MKRGLVLLALVMVPMLGACGPGIGGSAETTAAKVTEKVPGSEGPEGTRKGTIALAVGETATTTKAGNMLTVHSYESPVAPAGSSRPEPGHEFSAVEAEGCASQATENYRMVVGPSGFALEMPDGARLRPDVRMENMTVKEPALMSAEPGLGECRRGFDVFQTPEGERPELVIFEDPLTTETPVVTWKVPTE